MFLVRGGFCADGRGKIWKNWSSSFGENVILDFSEFDPVHLHTALHGHAPTARTVLQYVEAGKAHAACSTRKSREEFICRWPESDSEN